MKSRINDRDLPGLGALVVDYHLVVVGKIKCDIRRVKEVVCKPLLDNVLLIACTDDEFVITVVGIFLHYEPKDRHSADLDHRLGFIL